MLSRVNDWFRCPANRQEHRKLLTLAIPMVVANITIPLLGLVDTAVIGHLPHAYFLGATAVGSMIIGFVTWLFGVLRMSTSGMTAQACGQQQSQQALAILHLGLVIAGLVAMVLLFLQTPLINAGLALSGASEQVITYAQQYCQIRVWSYPAALANIVILGWLLGQQRSQAVMWQLIIINSANIAFDILFVVVLDWQVAGVAFATVLAEYLGCIYGLFICRRIAGQSFRHQFSLIVQRHWQGQIAIKRYWLVNADILIRTLCLQLSFITMTFVAARLGDNIVAANAILMNFLLLLSFGLDGIANAAEARAGFTYGQRQANAFNRVIIISLFWTGLLALAYSAFFTVLGNELIQLITSIETVSNTANNYLFWLILLPVIAAWCFLFDGVYIGLTESTAMRNGMLIATVIVFIPSVWLLLPYGNHGLWAAFTLFMAARGITLGWHFYRTVRPRVNAFVQNVTPPVSSAQ